MKKRINSKQKGKAVEREAVKFLTSMGFPCHRTAQNRGKTGDCADIEFEDEKFPFHVEVKGNKQIGLGTLELVKAWEQARDDAKAEGLGKMAVVLWKEHKKGWRLSWDTGYLFVTVAGKADIQKRFLLRIMPTPA